MEISVSVATTTAARCPEVFFKTRWRHAYRCWICISLLSNTSSVFLPTVVEVQAQTVATGWAALSPVCNNIHFRLMHTFRRQLCRLYSQYLCCLPLYLVCLHCWPLFDIFFDMIEQSSFLLPSLLSHYGKIINICYTDIRRSHACLNGPLFSHLWESMSLFQDLWSAR